MVKRKQPTQSSRLIEYLKNRSEKTFTLTQLSNEVASHNISNGAVSGLISKLKERGMISSDKQRPANYTIVGDLELYQSRKDIRARKKSQPVSFTLERNVDELIDGIIGLTNELKHKLDTQQVDLSTVSSKELVEELAKRVSAKKAGE